jgi:hypothetical protein
MVLLKSILTGLGAAALVGVALALWAQGLQYRVAMSSTSSESYVEVHWHPGVILCILVAVFAAGFWWQYRKAP